MTHTGPCSALLRVLAKQEQQNTLCGGEDQALLWKVSTAQRGGNAFSPVHPQLGFAKTYLQFGFLEAFFLLLTELGILVALWPR